MSEAVASKKGNMSYTVKDPIPITAHPYSGE
jgi:hypothetical protein